MALFVPLLSWLSNVAWYAWAGLAGAEAIIFAVFCLGQRLLLELPFWPAAVAGWWVTVEAFRDRWPYAFPWGRLAMSQSAAPDVRWVAVGGAPLLSFLVALAGVMLAWAALGFLRQAVPGPATAGRWPRSSTAGLVLAGGLLPVDPTGGAPTVPVTAIQGDVPRARNLPQQLNDSEVTQHQSAATFKLAAEVKAGACPRPPWSSGRRTGPTSTRARTPTSTPRSPGPWARSAGRC